MREELPLGLRFSIIGRAFRQIMDEKLKSEKITGCQFGTLRELFKLEASGAKEIYQRDLESAMHVTHPTMTEIIKKLEKKGFIVCGKSENDRRHKCLSLTACAHELCCSVNAAESYAERQLCRGVSESDMETLIRIIDIILDNAFMLKGEDAG